MAQTSQTLIDLGFEYQEGHSIISGPPHSEEYKVFFLKCETHTFVGVPSDFENPPQQGVALGLLVQERPRLLVQWFRNCYSEGSVSRALERVMAADKTLAKT